MLKVSVNFNFDSETETVSDLQCFVNGVEKKKTTTRKAPKKEIVLEDEALVIREENKLTFNNKAIADMGLSPEDRVAIKYIKFKGNKKVTPVIGTDLAFDNEGTGNKVTKSFTVAYRGNANKVLAEYGTTFSIEALEDGTWKLVSKDEMPATEEYEAIVEDIKEDEITVFTEDDQDTTINEMTFVL